MKILLCCLLTAAVFTGCGDAESAAVEDVADQATLASQNEAYAAMMAGHDRVMPLMGKVNQAQRTIHEKMEDTTLSEERRELLAAVNEQLEDANDGMMEWMSDIRSLDELREDEDADDIMEYIRESTASIAGVESAMVASLAAAEQLFGAAMPDHDHDHSAGGDHDHDH